LISTSLETIPTSFSRQREEKALYAHVIEAREQRDATIHEASEKVEAMKKESDGILGFLCLLSSNFAFS
jgi:hypothetical protein